jgi:hypothetical protein
VPRSTPATGGAPPVAPEVASASDAAAAEPAPQAAPPVGVASEGAAPGAGVATSPEPVDGSKP